MSVECPLCHEHTRILVCQSCNHSMNQALNQAIKHTARQCAEYQRAIDQAINQSVKIAHSHQSISQASYHSITQSIHQSINRFIHPFAHPVARDPSNQPTFVSIKQKLVRSISERKQRIARLAKLVEDEKANNSLVRSATRSIKRTVGWRHEWIATCDSIIVGLHQLVSQSADEHLTTLESDNHSTNRSVKRAITKYASVLMEIFNLKRAQSNSCSINQWVIPDDFESINQIMLSICHSIKRSSDQSTSHLYNQSADQSPNQSTSHTEIQHNNQFDAQSITSTEHSSDKSTSQLLPHFSRQSEELSAALGSIVHFTLLISRLIDAPIHHKMVFAGSFSYISHWSVSQSVAQSTKQQTNGRLSGPSKSSALSVSPLDDTSINRSSHQRCSQSSAQSTNRSGTPLPSQPTSHSRSTSQQNHQSANPRNNQITQRSDSGSIKRASTQSATVPINPTASKTVAHPSVSNRSAPSSADQPIFVEKFYSLYLPPESPISISQPINQSINRSISPTVDYGITRHVVTSSTQEPVDHPASRSSNRASEQSSQSIEPPLDSLSAASIGQSHVRPPIQYSYEITRKALTLLAINVQSIAQSVGLIDAPMQQICPNLMALYQALGLERSQINYRPNKTSIDQHLNSNHDNRSFDRSDNRRSADQSPFPPNNQKLECRNYFATQSIKQSMSMSDIWWFDEPFSRTNSSSVYRQLFSSTSQSYKLTNHSAQRSAVASCSRTDQVAVLSTHQPTGYSAIQPHMQGIQVSQNSSMSPPTIRTRPIAFTNFEDEDWDVVDVEQRYDTDED